ncbi:MAG: GCN5-related N-acetyltransferase [Pseudomonadota bacterium]
MAQREGELPFSFPVGSPKVPDLETQKRQALEASWIELTNRLLPSAAPDRRWPIHLNHCFQRVLLDHACSGVWYDLIKGRPAYRHASDEVLERAVEAGEACLDGTLSIPQLNQQSLQWRGKAR